MVMKRTAHKTLYGWVLLGTLLALALLQTQVLTPRPVLAENFVVNSTADTDTTGTLRNAIKQATANPDASTITFDLPENSEITLASDLPAITADLTIDGSGAPGLTINGTDNYTIFETDMTTGIDLSISNLELTNGSNARGGAVAFLSVTQDGSSLLLDNVTITSSSATDDGGAVFVDENAVATIQGSTIGGAVGDGNSAADEGGGIASYGTLTVTNSAVSHNSAGTGGAQDARDERGGGIFSALDTASDPDTSGPLTLDNVTVTNNTSQGRGGGVYSRASQLTITNSNIDDNATQDTTYGDAGGIYIGFGTAAHTITGGMINRNTSAGDGGGLYLNGDETLTITGTEIDSNEALSTNRSGGGIYVTESDLTLDNVTVTNNQTAFLGGGVYIGASIPPCIDTGNNNAIIEAEINDLIIRNNSTISGNTAKRGGGIATLNCDRLTITDSVIDGNNNPGSGFNSGGGIYANWTTTIARSTISNNSISNGDGGGIFFSNNYDQPLTISDSTISGNSTGNGGGGIYNFTTPITITNSTLITNTANYGGGIYNGSSSTLTVINSTLVTNTATTQGGGIYNVAAATLANAIVAGNTASTDANISGSITENGQNLTSGDPLLGSLADNGGPTLTLLPLEGSPAIDAGDDSVASGLTTDQRGFARFNSTVDIGAVELQTTSYGITLDPDSISEGDSGTTDVAVTVTRSGSGTSEVGTVDLALGGSAIENDDYTFTLTGSGTSFDGTTLSFDAGSTVATFALAVQGNNVDGDDKTVGLTLANATGPDGASIDATSPVTLTITDDDSAGVSVSPTSLTVGEGGTAVYSITLTSQPTATVTIDVQSNDTGAATVSPAALTFTAANWDAPQEVTVTGVDDSVVDGDSSATISHSATSSDSSYAGATIASVSVTITDNDGPAAPTVETPATVSSSTPVITGTAEAGLTVTLTIDLGNGESVTYETTAEDDGTWSIDLGSSDPISGTLPAGGLPDGNYPVSVTTTDADGNESTPTTSVLMVEDGGTPAAPPTIYLPFVAR